MCTSDGGIGGRNRNLIPEFNDIAGKGVADPGSLLEALKLASDLARR